MIGKHLPCSGVWSRDNHTYTIRRNHLSDRDQFPFLIVYGGSGNSKPVPLSWFDTAELLQAADYCERFDVYIGSSALRGFVFYFEEYEPGNRSVLLSQLQIATASFHVLAIQVEKDADGDLDVVDKQWRAEFDSICDFIGGNTPELIDIDGFKYAVVIYPHSA